jgi:hypothetical protein
MSTTLPEVVVTAQRDPVPAQPRQPPRLSHKRINVTFVKGGEGKFAESGTDTVKLSGLRVSCQVIKAGSASMHHLQLRMWGLTLSKMNDLSTLGLTQTTSREILNNTVIVEAGDDDAGMSVVHHGTVYDAFADFQGMPDCAFHISSHSGLYEAAKAVPPTSYQGMVDVATLMSGIASLAGWSFQNNGVTDKIEDAYYPGTAWEQKEAVAEHANINTTLLDGTPKTLVIWPKGQARDGQAPLINRDTGMIGYPAYTAQGIVVTTKYNAAIGHGQKVKVETDLASNNPSGIWVVQTLVHTLDAEVPHGRWETRFEATPVSLQSPQLRTSAP